jgi:hypothetical protein
VGRLSFPVPTGWVCLQYKEKGEEKGKIEAVSLPNKFIAFTPEERDAFILKFKRKRGVAFANKVRLEPVDGESRSLDPDIKRAALAIEKAKEYEWPIDTYVAPNPLNGLSPSEARRCMLEYMTTSKSYSKHTRTVTKLLERGKIGDFKPSDRFVFDMESRTGLKDAACAEDISPSNDMSVQIKLSDTYRTTTGNIQHMFNRMFFDQ